MQLRVEAIREEWSYFILSLDDDDRHWGGGPAVLGGQRLVTVPQDNNLKERRKAWRHLGHTPLEPKVAAPRWTRDASVTCSQAKVTSLQSEYENQSCLHFWRARVGGCGSQAHRVDDPPWICWCRVASGSIRPRLSNLQVRGHQIELPVCLLTSWIKHTKHTHQMPRFPLPSHNCISRPFCSQTSLI